MMAKWFKCEFLSDIVMNSIAATEGSPESLDFVPGANFLGIAAGELYNSLSGEDAFNVFHSGAVRFGDAHPALNNLRFLRSPGGWFHKKDESAADKIYQHHCLSTDEFSILAKSGIQLKQVRKGYFHPDAGTCKVDHAFSMKSAYDSGKRRTKDGILFGYDALSGGCEWIFSVEFEADKISPDLQNKIIKSIVGNKSVGRSKTGQYGRVNISLIDNYKSDNLSTEDKCGEYLLYAESRLAFFDKYGEPTLMPLPAMLGFPDGKILIEKSQIRSVVYAPWNVKRKTRDADRVCIEKGSVIVIKSETRPDSARIACGVGAYLAEGFGKLIINPAFLKNGFELKKCKNDSKNKSPSILSIDNDSDEQIITWFNERVTDINMHNIIYEAVVSQVEEWHSCRITPSQWGAVRAIASSSENYGALKNCLFETTKTDPETKPRSYEDHIKRKGKIQDKGFLKHGKAAEAWEKSGMAERLEAALEKFSKHNDERHTLQFAVLLCAEMAKKAKK